MLQPSLFSQKSCFTQTTFIALYEVSAEELLPHFKVPHFLFNSESWSLAHILPWRKSIRNFSWEFLSWRLSRAPWYVSHSCFSPTFQYVHSCLGLLLDYEDLNFDASDIFIFRGDMRVGLRLEFWSLVDCHFVEIVVSSEKKVRKYHKFYFQFTRHDMLF